LISGSRVDGSNEYSFTVVSDDASLPSAGGWSLPRMSCIVIFLPEPPPAPASSVFLCELKR
jgi:hypothetical protein